MTIYYLSEKQVKQKTLKTMVPSRALDFQEYIYFSMAETYELQNEKKMFSPHPYLLYIWSHHLVFWLLRLNYCISFKLFANVSWFMFVNISCLQLFQSTLVYTQLLTVIHLTQTHFFYIKSLNKITQETT